MIIVEKYNFINGLFFFSTISLMLYAFLNQDLIIFIAGLILSRIEIKI